MTGEIISSSPKWVADAVFYQIFPDRFARSKSQPARAELATWGDLPNRENFFGGDLQGILEHLDYLQNLGVNALYLNPIFQARTNHRYDASDYFQVDPMLGNQAALKELVGEMHRRGMHVILDGVFNHCGEGFAPFQDVLKNGASSVYADWFLARSYPLGKEPLNYLTCGGCTYLPKLNHANRKVQEFIFKVARYWLEETGMDGWRLDVPFKIPYDFWQEFRGVVKSVNPEAYLVGEVWREAEPWIKGDIFDGVTNYRLRDLILDYVQTNVLDGEDFEYELETLIRSHGEASQSMLNLLDSHDTPRILTTLKGDEERLKIAITIQMTLPGAPMVYYGDEVGMVGETDPDCRRCMPWDQENWDKQVYAFTRDLIALRNQHPALRYGQPQKLAAFNGIYAYHQAYAGDEAIIILNPRECISEMDIPTHSQFDAWWEYDRQMFHAAKDGVLHFDQIPARSAMVLIPEK